MNVAILAAGRNERFKSETDKSALKALAELNGQALISYGLDTAFQINSELITIVVSSKNTRIQNHLGNHYKNIPIHYISHKDPAGLLQSLKKIGQQKDDFLLTFCDEVFINSTHKEMVKSFENSNSDVLVGIVSVDNLQQVKETYSFEIDQENFQLKNFIEKPTSPQILKRGTGNIMFRSKIFNQLLVEMDQMETLADLLNFLNEKKMIIRGYEIASHYFNINSSSDLEKAKGFICKNSQA